MSIIMQELQKLTNCDSNDVFALLDAFNNMYPDKGNVAIALDEFFFNENTEEKFTESEILEILAKVNK